MCDLEILHRYTLTYYVGTHTLHLGTNTQIYTTTCKVSLPTILHQGSAGKRRVARGGIRPGSHRANNGTALTISLRPAPVSSRGDLVERQENSSENACQRIEGELNKSSLPVLFRHAGSV